MNLDSKKIEVSHYDRKMASLSDNQQSESIEININDYVTRAVSNYFDAKVIETLLKYPDPILLDYGCGTGQRTLKFAKDIFSLIGVDLSINSIKIAREISTGKGDSADYCLMDCEQLAAKSDSFDIVIDFGTFSSLRLDTAIEEVIRVLKSNGTLIAVETLGHNPLMNFKRKINVLSGARTKWAAQHILKVDNWEKISKYFNNFNIKYFGLMTPLLSPLFKILPKSIFGWLLEKFEFVDAKLLERPIMQKFAFKTVAIMSMPNK